MGRDFPPVQTGPGAHPASCTMGTGSFAGVKYGRGVLLTPHPLLVPRSWKSRDIPLPTLWATTGPVTGTLYLFLSSRYNKIRLGWTESMTRMHFALWTTTIFLSPLHDFIGSLRLNSGKILNSCFMLCWPMMSLDLRIRCDNRSRTNGLLL